jgi:PIN domain nuclease of toxin-antitoxin system
MFLPPALSHYQALISLPTHHADPFDRLIITQALVEGMTVVTCDHHFAAYGGTILW